MTTGGGPKTDHKSLCRDGHCCFNDYFYGEGASEGHVCVPMYGGGHSAVERELQSLHSGLGEAQLQGRVILIPETTHQAHGRGVRGKARSCPGSLGRRCPSRGASGHYGLIHHRGVSKGGRESMMGRQWKPVMGSQQG